MHVEDGPAPTLVLVSERWWDDIPTVRIQDTTGGPGAARRTRR
jgi:hypothetical protein